MVKLSEISADLQLCLSFDHIGLFGLPLTLGNLTSGARNCCIFYISKMSKEVIVQSLYKITYKTYYIY